MELPVPPQESDTPTPGLTPGDTPEPATQGTDAPIKKKLLELMLVCLKIGATSFGAPTAHIAMMEKEFVRKRHWITEEHFLDLLSAANLIPGPNASETCYHVGYVRAGYPGLLVAGFSFILPAFVTSAALGWAYIRYGGLPEVGGIFYFLNPLVLAIVLETTWEIGKSSLKKWQSLVFFGLALLAKILGVNETVIMLAAGALSMLWFYLVEHPTKGTPTLTVLLAGTPWLGKAIQGASGWLQSRTLQIFLYFFKTGSILFGSAMVLFGLVEKDITQRFGWLTTQQLTDAISVGQLTPGPVTSASTFIGYLAGGFPGAVASTFGVFLPSFIIVMLTAPLVKKMRESDLARAFLRGVNAAVIALILAVAYTLARNSLTDIWTILVFAAGLVALVQFDLMPYALVIAGLALGIGRALFS